MMGRVNAIKDKRFAFAVRVLFSFDFQSILAIWTAAKPA